MTDWNAILDELRAIRGSMDRIAALVAGQQAREELMPVWTCGHKHASRAAALACFARRPGASHGEDGGDTPPNADAGAFG